jgi:anhydro-N-acetylmuramic acid kinase
LSFRSEAKESAFALAFASLVVIPSGNLLLYPHSLLSFRSEAKKSAFAPAHALGVRMIPLIPKPLLVAGLMSGTSADGLDIALCRISPAAERQLPKLSVGKNLSSRPERSAAERPASAPAQTTPRLKLLAHTAHPYPADLRAAVLAAMDSKRTTTAELSRLHWRLGHFYADALAQTLKTTRLKPHLIALHGQTLYHQATAAEYLGQPTRTTWQIGEPSVLAERFHLPVISDFRPADLAAGGQGAPLVPMLDYALFRHRTRNRVLLNLGGIANLTAIPAAAGTNAVLAFDTGPANMVLDALTQTLTGRHFDCGGATAARGKTLKPILEQSLRNPYFQKQPPKSCGREEFGQAFTAKFLTACRKHSTRTPDILATATALTADSTLRAYADFVWPHLSRHTPLAPATDLIVAGGGARNTHLMRRLTEGFAFFGVKVLTTADTPSALPIEAKEAAAFALLAWLTWHGLPGNIPSATGATHPAILGKITPA